MKDKKSFLLYCDLIHTIKKLPDEKAGQLFKHIFAYVNDENPETDDLLIQVTFEPIKQQLKRDLVKWVGISEDRSEIGRIGGLKSGEARRNKAKQKKAIGSKSKQNEHVTVNVNDNVKEIDIYRRFAHLSITHTDCYKLTDLGYSKEQVNEVLDKIENYALNKKYKSLFITAKGWLKREFPEQIKAPRPKVIKQYHERSQEYEERHS